MDRELERRLARMEGKINLGLKAISWIAAFTCGFGVYFLADASEWNEWAAYVGFVAALLAGGLVDWRVRQLEKMLPP
jgi:hypothetical protein